MIIVSFFLDGLLSNYLSFPFFLTLTSIIFYSNFLNEDTFIKYSLVIGILYDITYTNTLFLNGILFFLIALFLKTIDRRYKNKLSFFLLLNGLIHLIYVMTIYLLLILFRYLTFDAFILIKGLVESILIDTIYFLILYFIYHKIKHHT